MAKDKQIVNAVQLEFDFVKDGPQCSHVESGKCTKCMYPLLPKYIIDNKPNINSEKK